MDCDCSRNFLVEIGRETDYRRMKTLLNTGRHPSFVGQSTCRSSAQQGGLIFATLEGVDVAVGLVKPAKSVFIALNVHPAHRSHGLGTAFLHYLRPNFARVIERNVPWFESRGYVPLGQMKQGKSLKTQIMVRGELIPLAGRLRAIFESGEAHG